jgi:hypothetical protein
VALKARRIETKGRLKNAAKKGGDSWVTTIRDNEIINLRFLTEPEDWIEYTEHYNDTYKYFPCSDDCPGCNDGTRGSKRYLAAAINVEEGAVVYFKLPKSVVSTLYRSYEKYGTIQDRDYEVARTGSGKNDTEYDTLPSQPSRVKFSRFPVPDGAESWADHCLKMLAAQLPSAQDGEEEEEELPPTSKSNGHVKSGSVRKMLVEDDEDEEDEEEDERPAKRKIRRVTR